MKTIKFHEIHADKQSTNRLSEMSVEARLPKKIGWQINGHAHVLECDQGLILKQVDSCIFVIQAPYDIKNNSAYVTTLECKLIANLPKTYDGLPLWFYDVFTRDSQAICLAATPKGDLQLVVEPQSGIVKAVSSFR